MRKAHNYFAVQVCDATVAGHLAKNQVQKVYFGSSI